MPVIYSIYCKSSKKYYIGQTKHTAKRRWRSHVEKATSNRDKQQCWALYNAIRLYKPDDFIVETLIECNESKLDSWEIKFIEFYNTLCPNGYNISKGGSFRTGPWRDESKDKLSNARRKYKNYNLPRSVVEINIESRNEFGFRVIHDSQTHTFISTHLSMDEKLKLALDCYNQLKSGQPYHVKNKFKRGNEKLDVPLYVVKRGENGFAVNKSGCLRKTFNHKGNTREQNLQNAINYLNTL